MSHRVWASSVFEAKPPRSGLSYWYHKTNNPFTAQVNISDHAWVWKPYKEDSCSAVVRFGVISRSLQYSGFWGWGHGELCDVRTPRERALAFWWNESAHTVSTFLCSSLIFFFHLKISNYELCRVKSDISPLLPWNWVWRVLFMISKKF